MERIKDIILAGSDGLPILVDIFFKAGDERKAVVIYSHGFNGFKDWGNFDMIAEKFAEAGFVFVKFNFSHNGTTVDNPEQFENLEAFGKNNYTKQMADLKIVTDWIRDPANPFNRSIDRDNINLLGHSMGAGISILFAAEYGFVKKLVTWASINECKTPWGNWPEERIDQWKISGVEYYLNGRTNQKMPLYYQLYEDYEQNKKRLDIRTAIESLSIPILICHGTLDQAVSVDKAYELKKWQPNANLFVVATDHVFGRKHPWTANHLPKPMEEVVAASMEFLK